MKPRRLFTGTWVLIASLFFGFLILPKARGDLLLNHQFSGELSFIDDPWGLFGQNQIGDPFFGKIELCNGVPGIDYGGLKQFLSDVVVEPNRLRMVIGSLEMRPSTEYLTQVAGPAWGLVGVDFQFSDGDPSLLNLAGLPAGHSVSNVGALVGFYSENLNLPSSYPNLPTSLHPLSEYEFDRSLFVFADVFDSLGNYVATPALVGEVTSLQSIPEPSTTSWMLACLLVATGLMGAAQKAEKSSTRNFAGQSCPGGSFKNTLEENLSLMHAFGSSSRRSCFF